MASMSCGGVEVLLEIKKKKKAGEQICSPAADDMNLSVKEQKDCFKLSIICFPLCDDFNMSRRILTFQLSKKSSTHSEHSQTHIHQNTNKPVH